VAAELNRLLAGRGGWLRRLGVMHTLEVACLVGIVVYGFSDVDAFSLDRAGKYFLLAALALSVDLVWGYAGLVTLGHAVFFGVGSYAAALVLVRQVGGLPPSVVLSLVLGAAIAALFAGVLGLFLFAGRGVQGGYFALATLAVAFLAEQYLNSSGPLLGGFNGIPNLPYLHIGPLDVSFGPSFYWFCALFLCAVYGGLRVLLRSRLGLLIRGLREKEQRLNYLGYQTARLKWSLFVASAGLAGLVGALYAIHDGFVSPQLAGVELSTQIVTWVAIGGTGTLLGPILGTLLINASSAWLSSVLVNDWLLVLAAVLILMIRLRPAGILGGIGVPTGPTATDQPRDERETRQMRAADVEVAA
jgi:branched-chain amino acid transport system permease protein